MELMQNKLIFSLVTENELILVTRSLLYCAIILKQMLVIVRIFVSCISDRLTRKVTCLIVDKLLLYS